MLSTQTQLFAILNTEVIFLEVILGEDITMKILFEDGFWKVTITWSKPMLYENLIEQGSQHDENAHLYMISGKHQNNKHKVYYIGKTYDQCVSDRLTQSDHKLRYKNIKKDYPRHTLYVSHGIVEIKDGKRTSKRIDEIESILIYSMPAEHSFNEKNYFSHGVTGQYLINNKGHKSSLPNTIGLGVFTK